MKKILLILGLLAIVLSSCDLFIHEYTFQNNSSFNIHIMPNSSDSPFDVEAGKVHVLKTTTLKLQFLYSPYDNVIYKENYNTFTFTNR